MPPHQTNLCASSCSIYLHVILLFSIWLLCLQPTIITTAPTNETDRLALLKFKESVTRDPYKILSSWNNSMHFCNWLGITCGRRHQRVTRLDLPSYELHGSISPYIGNLTFLMFIQLYNNSFYGEIPQKIGHLFRLQHLLLKGNMLAGEIPSSLSNCSNLMVIKISVNKLKGRIPSELGYLMKLEELVIHENNLTGGIPPSLGNLSSVAILSVGHNNLGGNISDAIGQLKSLIGLSISSGKFSGTIPSSLYNVSSLQIISVSGNQLNGTLPANIGINLPNLQRLLYGGNEFSGPIPTSLCNATQLQMVDLRVNNILGSVPTTLGNLLDLYALGLSNNNLGRSLKFLTYLTNCSKLDLVDLRINRFGGVLPNSVANLSNQLTQLYLGENEISGTIPASLANLDKLIVLSLDDNHFTGIIPASFRRFQKLQVLLLTGNNLSGEIPTFIGNLTELFQLFLNENLFEGTIPPSIVNCQLLQFLDISLNKLNGSISQHTGLSSLPLVVLNLSHNSLTGKLPFEVANLKNINELDVSNNHLSGEIPTSIGNCLILEHLYLQGNFFKGAIPSSLASLRGLRHLDVSQNNLSGPIPKGLEMLPFLEFLNLSFNNFEGEVPTEGIFKNTSVISLIGNTNLCGGIPQLQLPKCPTSCSMVPTIDLLLNVSYKELYQATNGFSPNNLIGSGSFGSVYKGALDQEERLVAIKVLNLQHKGASKSFMAECNALRNIRHRNLVKILTCCSSMDYGGNQFKALVFEFMTNGGLDIWLHPGIPNEHQSRNLSLLQRLNVAIDVALAIDYLHNHSTQPIVHCDLKPSNVLLDHDMVAHVNDFGLARLLSITDGSSAKQTSSIGIKGSIGYAAPEYGMSGEASMEGDVYSYGILLLEMFLGKRPTDEMFKNDLNLHNFAKMGLPERVVQIVDPILLPREVVATPIAIVATREDNNDNEIHVDKDAQGSIANLSQMDANMHKCLVSILEIGLAFSMESPKERMKMEEVTRELHLIKNAYLGSGIHSGLSEIPV
nr:probable LRR receptor-like serine/threonine-protein kinase At3g47570 [Quercus suber]